MKKVTYRNRISKVLGFSILVFLLSSISLLAQAETAEAPAEQAASSAGDAGAGKALFNQNCAACHALDRKMTGPALRNVEARLAEDEGLDREWLYKWIKNSPGLIKSGDAYANKVYGEYNQAAMTPFPTLSNADIDNILAYTAAEAVSNAGSASGSLPVPGGASGEVESSGVSNEVVLGALVLVFLVLVFLLISVNKTLRNVMEVNGVDLEAEGVKKISIWKAFVKNQFLVIVSVLFLMLGGAYFVYGFLMQVGVDQGYAPIQPIHYSHRIHAGDNKIECKYCHSSARKSKTSGIPSLNVCMNCHKSIGEVADATQAEGVAEYGVDYNKEIQKLYKAVGWDSDTQSYTGETESV